MSDNLGRLVLRLTIGVLMLFHGIAKLQTFGVTIDKMGQMLNGVGLPAFIAYGVFIGEVIAPILVIVGFLARPAALVISFTMVAAIALAHRTDLLSFNPQSGGYVLELQFLFLFGGIAIALLGSGQYSASQGKWRWD